MSRDLPADYVTSSLATVYPYILAYMDFSGSAPVRLWTGIESKSFTDFSGSAVYSGVGTLGNITAITETTEVSAKGIELTLTGVPTEYVSLALSGSYRGRDVAVYMVVYSSSFSDYDQINLFKGYMDQMTIEEGADTSIIKLKCENRLIALNRVRDLRYTDEIQKESYPTDKGLEFVSSLGLRDIYWGNSGPASTGNTGTDTGGGDGEDITGGIR